MSEEMGEDERVLREVADKLHHLPPIVTGLDQHHSDTLSSIAESFAKDGLSAFKRRRAAGLLLGIRHQGKVETSLEEAQVQAIDAAVEELVGDICPSCDEPLHPAAHMADEMSNCPTFTEDYASWSEVRVAEEMPTVCQSDNCEQAPVSRAFWPDGRVIIYCQGCLNWAHQVIKAMGMSLRSERL